MAKKLGFGLMRLPLTDPNDGGSIDMAQLKDMVDKFLEQGFTYFDTAWMYCEGKSECAVKEALTLRHPRESFTVTSKLPSYMLKTKEDRDKIFFEQLTRQDYSILTITFSTPSDPAISRPSGSWTALGGCRKRRLPDSSAKPVFPSTEALSFWMRC